MKYFSKDNKEISIMLKKIGLSFFIYTFLTYSPLALSMDLREHAQRPRSNSAPNVLNPNVRQVLRQAPSSGFNIEGNVPVDIRLPDRIEGTLNHTIPAGTVFPEVPIKLPDQIPPIKIEAPERLPDINISTHTFISGVGSAGAIAGIVLFIQGIMKEAKADQASQDEGKKLKKQGLAVIAGSTAVILHKQIFAVLSALFSMVFKSNSH